MQWSPLAYHFHAPWCAHKPLPKALHACWSQSGLLPLSQLHAHRVVWMLEELPQEHVPLFPGKLHGWGPTQKLRRPSFFGLKLVRKICKHSSSDVGKSIWGRSSSIVDCNAMLSAECRMTHFARRSSPSPLYRRGFAHSSADQESSTWYCFQPLVNHDSCQRMSLPVAWYKLTSTNSTKTFQIQSDRATPRTGFAQACLGGFCSEKVGRISRFSHNLERRPNSNTPSSQINWGAQLFPRLLPSLISSFQSKSHLPCQV